MAAKTYRVAGTTVKHRGTLYREGEALTIDSSNRADVLAIEHLVEAGTLTLEQPPRRPRQQKTQEQEQGAK